MEYFAHLLKDKRLKPILKSPFAPLEIQRKAPLRLIESIMGQQLSIRVAQVLKARFYQLCGRREPSLKKIISLEVDTLRSIGLSHAKASYIHNVARYCLKNKITDQKLQEMRSEDIITLLTDIKGVGRWTVEMLLMFSLGREDIMPLDDLGIQQAMATLYHLDTKDKKSLKDNMIIISESWRPYRSYACLHLWDHKDNPLL